MTLTALGLVAAAEPGEDEPVVPEVKGCSLASGIGIAEEREGALPHVRGKARALDVEELGLGPRELNPMAEGVDRGEGGDGQRVHGRPSFRGEDQARAKRDGLDSR